MCPSFELLLLWSFLVEGWQANFLVKISSTPSSVIQAVKPKKKTDTIPQLHIVNNLRREEKKTYRNYIVENTVKGVLGRTGIYLGILFENSLDFGHVCRKNHLPFSLYSWKQY